MSGNKGLVDSNILIYMSNESMEIDDLLEKYNGLLISRITHMEVLGYKFENKEDEELVRKLISKFPILEIDSMVGESTIEIRKKKKIKLPDAIILATAKINNCELITANEKDFQGIEKDVVIFNPFG